MCSDRPGWFFLSSRVPSAFPALPVTCHGASLGVGDQGGKWEQGGQTGAHPSRQQLAGLEVIKLWETECSGVRVFNARQTPMEGILRSGSTLRSPALEQPTNLATHKSQTKKKLKFSTKQIQQQQKKKKNPAPRREMLRVCWAGSSHPSDNVFAVCPVLVTSSCTPKGTLKAFLFTRFSS